MRWIAYGGFAALLAGCAETEPRAALGELCDEATPCVAGAYCKSDGYSRACGEQARCVAVEEACEAAEQPACGCDGVVYAGACAAAMAGVDVQVASACEAPAGTFVCRDRYCQKGSEYCEYTFGGGAAADDALCLELGCEGDAQGCACLPDESPCGEDGYYLQMCDMAADGETHLLCLWP